MKLFGLSISRARERKESPTWSGIMAFLSGQQSVHTPADYATITKAGYQMNPVAHACVALIAKTASRISWYATRLDRNGERVEIESHPALALIERPNEYQSGPHFIEAVVSYRLLAGNAYVHKVSGSRREPQYLYTYRPDRMTIKPGDRSRLVGGYVYKVNGNETPLAVEDVLHLREFHPLNDFYGLSKLEVAAGAVDVSNCASDWNLKLLQNDMRPPGILSINGTLTDQKRRTLEQLLREKYQGGENAGKPLVIESGQGMEWKPTAISPRDMDWLNAEKFNMRRICAVFGVASELLGDSENKTYSNIQEARRALYMETVLPIMDELCSALNSWLMPTYGDGATLEYDRDTIEALQEDRAAKYGYLNSARFLTVNEKREAAGYEAVGREGDVILASAGDMPLEFVSVDPLPVVADADVAGQKSLPLKAALWSAPERKSALWDNFVRRVETKERTLVALSLRFLRGQAERVGQKRGVDVAAEAKAYAATVRPWATQAAVRAIAAGVRSAKGELPEIEEKAGGFEALTQARKKELDDMILRSGTKIAETTMAYVRDTLVLAEAEDWTVEELTRKLQEKLAEFAQWRCRLVARTETGKVENWGNIEGYKDTEYVNKKGWLCARVEDSRDEHLEADGQEVAIDADFSVGGQAMAYPGDPKGDAGNVCNCLCTTYPVVD